MEAKDGSGKRSKIEVVAERIHFVGNSKGGNGNGGGGDSSYSGNGGGNGGGGYDQPWAPIDDEDIPF